MRMKTNISSLSAMSVIFWKSFITNFPDSENHLLKRECALISTSTAKKKKKEKIEDQIRQESHNRCKKDDVYIDDSES